MTLSIALPLSILIVIFFILKILIRVRKQNLRKMRNGSTFLKFCRFIPSLNLGLIEPENLVASGNVISLHISASSFDHEVPGQEKQVNRHSYRYSTPKADIGCDSDLWRVLTEICSLQYLLSKSNDKSIFSSSYL